VKKPPTKKLDRTAALAHIAPALHSLAVPTASLELDPRNARLHGERNMATIKASLEKFRQVKPIVTRGKRVVAGNATLRAFRELGWPLIARIDAEHLSPAEAAAYGVADNRTAELAEWDLPELSGILAELPAELRPATGFDDDELAALLKRVGGPEAPDDFPDVDPDADHDHRCPKCRFEWNGPCLPEKRP
jgi:ParB-like chromosome segregation protein Spo0J